MNDPSKVALRQITASVDVRFKPSTIKDAIWQHYVLCQTYFPYRRTDESTWESKNGNSRLLLQQVKQYDNNLESQAVGLPYGTKARLIITYLNNLAVKTQSPTIDTQASMTQFVKALDLSSDGRNIAAIKDQLKRIKSSLITIAFKDDNDRVHQSDMKILSMFDVSLEKNAKQKVLWNNYVVLDDAYFKSLIECCIPMDERALLALSHSAMAMDVYAWLCQRLFKLESTVMIPWVRLQEQFGKDYARLRDFRKFFIKMLQQVLCLYPGARVVVDVCGLHLSKSPPAIPTKTIITIPTK